MHRLESRKLATALNAFVSRGATNAHVSDAIVSTWQEIEAALSAIIGAKGVAALYSRSVFLVQPRHPWLGAAGAEPRMDLVQLRYALERQDRADVATAAGAHLEEFYELLASLIGPALTAQLLRGVWDNRFDGSRTQEKSQ